MPILTHDEIIRRVRSGEIGIDPFDERAVGPASVDLHLANHFRVFRRVREIFHVTESADYGDVTEIVEVGDDDYFVLMPGETAHGITRERIRLPETLCGWLQGRSRFARVGLMVHITAAFIQPGVDNKQALEINNAGPMPLAIRPGIAACQFIFEECVGRAKYDGRYRAQLEP
ncbi:MAG TPA: dCTP deaminase [Chloroflexota bacterium]|nr:dCTP deaminase [Chloroflexota bacterium]